MAITVYAPKNRAHAIEAARHQRAPLRFPEEYTFHKTVEVDCELVVEMTSWASPHLEWVDDDCEDEDVIEVTLHSPDDDGHSYTQKFKTDILGNRYECANGRVFVAALKGFEELTA